MPGTEHEAEADAYVRQLLSNSGVEREEDFATAHRRSAIQNAAQMAGPGKLNDARIARPFPSAERLLSVKGEPWL